MEDYLKMYLVWVLIFVLLGACVGIWQVVSGCIAKQAALIAVGARVIFASMAMAVLMLAVPKFLDKALHAPEIVLDVYYWLMLIPGVGLAAFIISGWLEFIKILKFLLRVLRIFFGAVSYALGFVLENLGRFLMFLGEKLFP